MPQGKLWQQDACSIRINLQRKRTLEVHSPMELAFSLSSTNLFLIHSEETSIS